jgi:hypothetical protein
VNNEKLDLFDKGDYQPIDSNFMVEGSEVLQEVTKVQEKFGKNDTDTFINELRDSIVGHYLGFDYVNVQKHGFDCKMKDENVYLEVKSASFTADTWRATFNDTTLEKSQAFKDTKLFLALAVWKNASDLLFLAFGQNEKIGQFLESKVQHFKSGNTVRSTQSIPFSTLVFSYNFKILCVSKTKQEVKTILRNKSSRFLSIRDESFIELEDFKGIKNYTF